MINEHIESWPYNPRISHSHLRKSHRSGIDLGGIIWADSTGYVGNLFLLWLALVVDYGTWNLVPLDIPEVDAQIHNISWGE